MSTTIIDTESDPGSWARELRWASFPVSEHIPATSAKVPAAGTRAAGNNASPGSSTPSHSAPSSS